jgi:hypothetical protein
MNPSKLIIVLTCAALAGSTIAVSGQQASNKPDAIREVRSHPHELYGFLLLQDRKAIEAELGKPFQEGLSPMGNLASGYHLRGFKENYLIAFYPQIQNSYYKDKIRELQLTGTEPSDFTGFFGLELGDSAEKVEASLGKPTNISHEDNVNVDSWNYEEGHYYLEFTPSHKLYSIRIDAEAKEVDPSWNGASEVYAFAQAVKAQDVDMIMSLSSGEIVCLQKEWFGIQGRKAREILKDKASPISVCLAKAADAILALGAEMKTADISMRAWERRPPGMVVKFPKNSPLLEVVLVDEAGAPRIYEVTFR